MTERGRIDQDVTEATIRLFDTSAVRRVVNQPERAPVEPTVLLRMSALVNGGAIISRMKWESGGDSLLFLGRDGSENRQLFRVSLRDHKLTSLSLPTHDVIHYIRP